MVTERRSMSTTGTAPVVQAADTRRGISISRTAWGAGSARPSQAVSHFTRTATRSGAASSMRISVRSGMTAAGLATIVPAHSIEGIARTNSARSRQSR